MKGNYQSHYQMMSDDELIEAAKYQTRNTNSKMLAEELAIRLDSLLSELEEEEEDKPTA
jgi:hypothetical protein